MRATGVRDTTKAFSTAIAIDGRGPGEARLRSGQDRLDDLPVHVGQAEVAALEVVGQPGVVDPQQMQDRGVQVVDVDGVLDDVVGEVVGLAVASCPA